jgi:hypothetical protein
MPPRKIYGQGFEKYQIVPITEGHPLFSHVNHFPDIVKGPKKEWVMTATRNPQVFYPTDIESAFPSAIRGVHRFKLVGDEYRPQLGGRY